MVYKENPVTGKKSKWGDGKRGVLLTALVANSKGNIFELNGYAAVGMAGDSRVVLTKRDTQQMPYGSELMYLPDRYPILYDIEKGKFEALRENPFRPGEPIFPVAAFNSPGFMLSYVSAYGQKRSAGYLPLFSYGAVGWHNSEYRAAVILVDREKRQDLRLMKRESVLAGIREMRKQMPTNRLRQHLESCALRYGCPAGKNFFLGRYEAPLPTAQHCNARCIGCLSLQMNNEIPCSQDRIGFTPSCEEIAEVALSHIGRVKKSIQTIGRRFKRSLGNNDIAFWLISQRMLPPVAVVIPIYVLFQQLHLLDTRTALIITYVAINLPIVIWLMRDYFQTIPLELEECASIDGASRYRIFWTIVLPLAVPGLVATFLFVLVFTWNEYLLALFLSGADAQTMPLTVAAQNNTRGPQWWYMSVLILIMIVPVIAIAIALERFIARGLLVGAVKG